MVETRVSLVSTKRAHAGSRADTSLIRRDRMIQSVPFHKGRNAFGYGRGRLKAVIASDRIDIGKAFRHVARLQGQHAFLSRTAQLFLKYSNHVEKVFGIVVPDIVQTMSASSAYRLAWIV